MVLDLSVTNGIVSSKIYDKRDDINFEIGNFPYLDGNSLRPPPPPFVFIFRSLFVLRECALMLVVSTTAAKLLKQGYRYHKIRKAFSTFYRIHLELIVNNIGLKKLLQQGPVQRWFGAGISW